MPHQCTACGRTFDDGSKEMLSGCPDCGGNKFQFQPQRTADATPTRPAGGETTPAGGGTTPTSGESPYSPDDVRGGSTTDGTTAPDPTDNTTAASADSHESTAPTGSKPKPSAQGDIGNDDPTSETKSESERLDETNTEDTAQASARSDVVSPDELNRASRDVSSSTPANDVDTNVERPDIDDLRDELNAQFESIRIVSPGKYELNLMELYDRQEYIISLQEDGRYVIEMPDSWGIGDE